MKTLLDVTVDKLWTKCSNRSVAIGKQQVHKASVYGSKQQKRPRATIILLLLVRATYIRMLLFAHIPFIVYRAFNATPNQKLQRLDPRTKSEIGPWFLQRLY